MVLTTCPHFEEFRRKEGLGSYKLITTHLVAAHTIENPKFPELRECYNCKKKNLHLHTCLHCVYTGCYPKGHMEQHAAKKNHPLGVQLMMGFIRCFVCKSNICNELVYNVVQPHFSPDFNISELMKSLQREHEKNIIAKNQYLGRVYLQEDSVIGLRGLQNLGNTCFMNCIVQTLTHTPFLRDYLLSDPHTKCFDNRERDKCIVCEIHTLFLEFYSGKKSTYLLHRLLYLIWTNARHLAGYEQQDAHEFLIAILDVLHKHSRPTSQGVEEPCVCIVDKIFTGLLQSDLVCQLCKSVSTTVDPFWDISLNINLSGEDGSILTLVDCLEQFIRPEHLGPAAKIWCKTCNMNQESTKQLTINNLPIIVCFHLKRFEHSTRFHKKIGTAVQFPAELDMGPFTTNYRDTRNNLSMAGGEIPELQSDRSASKYSLFSVVNHHGNIDSGHYTCYIKLDADNWYRCDDDIISKTSLHDVLSSEGYLLFYHKLVMEYE